MRHGAHAARCDARPAFTRQPPIPARPADYVDFLTSVTPENQEEFMMQASARHERAPAGSAARGAEWRLLP